LKKQKDPILEKLLGKGKQYLSEMKRLEFSILSAQQETQETIIPPSELCACFEREK
jgi:hypothetical protein